MKSAKRRRFVRGATAALLSHVVSPVIYANSSHAQRLSGDKYNVLLITVDDMDSESTGLFADKNAHLTPNINGLGERGVAFKLSHVAISECWPSRTAIFTGRLPHRNGTTTFKPIDPDILVLPKILQDTGYLTGLAGKSSHTLPTKRHVFNHIYPGEATRYGRDPDAFHLVTRNFIERAQKRGKPFFLNLNIEDPHRPFLGSPADRDVGVMLRNFLEKIDPFELGFLKVRPAGSLIFDPDSVHLPGFLPDLPEIRMEMAAYYGSVARADRSVGRILEALQNTGAAENTVIVFLSDNGIHMPFGKANVYPASTLASLVIYVPFYSGKTGVRDEYFVSSLDIFPTILDLLGIEPVRYTDGRSLHPLFLGSESWGTNHCFTYRYLYPMRAVHTKRYTYIYNAWSDGQTKFQNFFISNPSAIAIKNRSKDDPEMLKRYKHFLYREKEELYDTVRDPYCLDNIISEKNKSATLSHMRDELYRQMKRTDDNLTFEFENTI